MGIQSQLVKFLSDEIEPHLERKRIQDAHKEVRDLTEDILQEVLLSSFVMGSYKRHTLIRRSDESKKYDVDVMFVLDEKEELETMLDTMEVVASSIADQIEDVVTYRRQRVSVGLIYDDNFSIDMVPGLEGEEDYIIYDSKELKPIKTNPLKHVQIISDLNDQRNNLLVPLIKLIKKWRQENASECLKSFHLEILAAAIFKNNEISDYLTGLNAFFDEAFRMTQAEEELNDPVGGHNIAGYLDDQDNPKREEANELLKKARDATADAIDQEKAEKPELAQRALGRIYEYFRTEEDTSVASSINTALKESNAPKPWSD